MTKDILILLKNNFLNDARVEKIANSLVESGNIVTLIAAKEFKGIPTFEIRKYILRRIPLFSSIYSKSQLHTSAIEATKKNSRNLKNMLINSLKNNKFRLFCTEYFNSISFLIGGLAISLKSKSSIVYCNDLDTLLLGWFITKLKKSKLVYDSHEIWLEGNAYQAASAIKKYFWKHLELHVIRRCDLVFTTTDTRANYLCMKYKLSDIKVIKNCPINQNVDNRNLLRKEFNIPENQKIVLYQGLIHKKRGILNMVDVIESIPEMCIVFIGEGRHTNELIEYINLKKLNSRAFYKPAVPWVDLIQYTASADIGLQLLMNTGINHYSTISNKIFEYIMVGIPILASNFPEITKIVSEDSLGFTVDPMDIAAIKECLIKLLDNLSFYKNKVKKVNGKYDWRNEEKVLCSAIKEL